MKDTKRDQREFEALEPRRMLTNFAINPVPNSDTQGYTPDEIRSAYGVDNIHFGPVGDNYDATGLGEVIDIVVEGDDKYMVSASITKTTQTSKTYPFTYGQSDVGMFERQYPEFPELVNWFHVVGPDGTAGSRPNYTGQTAAIGSSQMIEDALDVEWAHAMAPEAKINLVETANIVDFASYAEAFTTGVATTGANIVETSSSFGNDYVRGTLPESMFNQTGVVFIAASGDNGAPSYAIGDYPDVVDVAASNPTLNDDGAEETGFGSSPTLEDIASYSSETGWSNPPSGPSGFNEGGSGGGYSTFPTPSYQQGLVISDGNQTISADGLRVTPDVSFVGGSQSGWVDIVAMKQDMAVAGTSAAAPAFAGLVALTDDGITSQGGQNLDSSQFLTALYGLPSTDFHDITSGYNGYSAGAGYDLVSGLGSPVANLMVPDIARDATAIESLTTPIQAVLSYEAPELYATPTATTPIADNLNLSLGTVKGVSTILITNNGTVVATAPFAATSAITINGADFANDNMTVNFSGGNPIPGGGLTFDGTTFDGGPAGSSTLTITGTLPTNTAGTTGFTSEVNRPLSPTSGFFQLGGVTNNNGVTLATINYLDMGTKGSVPPILDNAAANNATYTVLGNNIINPIQIAQVPIGGTQYTQVSSATNLFVPVDFVNKTNITVTDSDGNDFLNLDFDGGNPLPSGGLTFNGGTGVNTVTVTGNHNFALGVSTLTDMTTGGGGLKLLNVQNFVLNGGAGNNMFTLDGWTGTGTINGGGGSDTVTVETPANMGTTVNSAGYDVVGDSMGMLMTLQNIAYTVLNGTGSGALSYTVNAWASGTLWLNGGTGADTYNIGSPQTGDLDQIFSSIPVGINAFGNTNNVVMYDTKNNTFSNYSLSDTLLTSTQQNSVPRNFAGVRFGTGRATNITLDANPQGGTFNVTPSSLTAFTINGPTSPFPSNFLNVVGINTPSFVAAQSPTLFNTGPSTNPGSAGIFLFASDKGIKFSNMINNPLGATNYSGSAGAVNAVASVAGAGSSPNVNIINSVTGAVLISIPNVYPANYTGGVQLALGDVNGDGVPDLIVAPGLSQTPTIKIYNILTGALEYQFAAQTSSYIYGMQVAVGDVNGDGYSDLIVAPLVGAANVEVFLNTKNSSAPFTPYSTSTPVIHAFSNLSNYQGGVGGLAIGNVTGHAATSKDPLGVGDIVVGSGVGTNAVAQVFDYFDHPTSSTPALTITPNFSASVSGGLSVAVADVDGDGVNDVVMGAGMTTAVSSSSGLIDVWSGKTKTITQQIPAFTGAGSNAPVHVAIARIGNAFDILAAQGVNAKSHQLEQFTYNGSLPPAPAVDTVMETQTWLQNGINLD